MTAGSTFQEMIMGVTDIDVQQLREAKPKFNEGWELGWASVVKFTGDENPFDHRKEPDLFAGWAFGRRDAGEVEL